MAEDGLVRLNTDFVAARDCALDDDVQLAVRLGGLGELGQRRHGGRGATTAASCATIGAGITDGARLGDRRTLGDRAKGFLLRRRSWGSRGEPDEGKVENVGELHLKWNNGVQQIQTCKFNVLQKPVPETEMNAFKE